jgi:hypothetical protein
MHIVRAIARVIVRPFDTALRGSLPWESGASKVIIIDPPANSVAPVASVSDAGTAIVGVALECTDGTWARAETFTYQWQRDAVNITDATENTYTPVQADEGTSVTCIVTAYGPGGNDSATSNAIAVVAWVPSDVAGADELGWYGDDYTDVGGTATPIVNKYNPGTRNLVAGDAPTWTDPDADYNNEPGYSYNGSSDNMVVTSSAANFNPLHNGTGSVLSAVFKPDNAATGAAYDIVGNAGIGGSTTGTQLRFIGDGGTGAMQFWVGKGSAPSLINIITADDSCPRNAVHRVLAYVEDGSYELYVDGELVAGGTYTQTPAAGNATASLRVGRHPQVASNFYLGSMAEVVAHIDTRAKLAHVAYLERVYA